jgi:hypothetical protein
MFYYLSDLKSGPTRGVAFDGRSLIRGGITVFNIGLINELCRVIVLILLFFKNF